MATTLLSPAKTSMVTMKPSPSKRHKTDFEAQEDVVLKKEQDDNYSETKPDVVKPSPAKKQKIEDESEPEDDVKVKLEPKDYDSSDDLAKSRDGEEDENKVKRKDAVKLRLGNIFTMATMGDGHRPSRKDFVPRNGPFPKEMDPSVLSRRIKQLEYGKSTVEYKRYVEAVPKHERLSSHPWTPNMHRKYSRRAWDGLVRLWRCNLHIWDQNPEDAEAERFRLLHDRRSKAESRSSTGESTSTSSSIMGEGDNCFFSENEDVDITVTELKVKVEDTTKSPTSTVNRSWYEETLEFEDEYPDLLEPIQ